MLSVNDPSSLLMAVHPSAKNILGENYTCFELHFRNCGIALLYGLKRNSELGSHLRPPLVRLTLAASAPQAPATWPSCMARPTRPFGSHSWRSSHARPWEPMWSCRMALCAATLRSGCSLTPNVRSDPSSGRCAAQTCRFAASLHCVLPEGDLNMRLNMPP